MTAQMRSCSRTGCRWPAAASLSFRYVSRQAWLLDLRDPDPALYDLCPHHADNLVVPRGWQRVDQRTDAPAVREPSGQELVTRAGRLRAAYPAVTTGHLAPAPVPVTAAAAAAPAAARPRELIPRAPAPPVPRPPAPAPRVNRYEGLHRDLPRLAAELADTFDDLHPDVRGQQGSEPGVIVPIDVARRPLHPAPGSPLKG